MNKNTKLGFTIVELLIVIVTIAIISSISIVAFNGIQARAKLVMQTAELDKIGKAIQLWSAETGKALGESGAGYSGRGVGSFTAEGGSYSLTSVENLLRNSGYLKGEINENAFAKDRVMVSPCTNNSDARWVVLASVNPAPRKTVAEQISETGCSSSYLPMYTSDPYNRNLIKAY